jgi:hypothetical protein
VWFLSIAAVDVTRRQEQSPMLARNRAIVQTLCSGLYPVRQALTLDYVQSCCPSCVK